MNLIDKIQTDQINRSKNKVDEVFSVNIFNPKSEREQSTTGLNGQFVHSQLLIDCLITMEQKESDKNDFIGLAKKFYQDNRSELQVIEEFERDYVSDRAVWWYTRESFLYRLLNKALRVQDMDLLFLFRFFIRDLHQQLERLQNSTSIRVYRGQLIALKELEGLKRSVGQLISMNSFLSTSIDRRAALSFLLSSSVSGDLQRILFEIDLDPALAVNRPFANITEHSFFAQEQEVLVMLGSIFELIEIKEDKKCWVVHMKLANENENNAKVIYDYMKKQYGETDQRSSLFNFGVLLFKMGQYEKAEKYCQLLLKELSPDHADRAGCYHNLGVIANHQGKFEESLDWFKKAIDTYRQTLNEDDPILACTYNSMGEVYCRQGDRKNALQWFNKALTIRKKALGEDHLLVAMCYHNMGNVYQEEKQLNQAYQCHERSMMIRQKYLPADHPDVGASYHCLAGVCLCMNYPDQALQYYNRALKIYEKSLPSDHADFGMIYYNLGLLYEGQRNMTEALKNFEKASLIFRATLPADHPFIGIVDRDVQRVSSRVR